VKQVAVALALVAAYCLGTMQPHAMASDADGVIRELREIKVVLADIRRVVEKGARP
jgi:hypothetical protein